MLKKLKKFKPNTKYNLKTMSLWVGVFAAIGVTALLLTRAAVPNEVEANTLNANYNINGATGWTPFNGTVYKADQSASPGSGSFYWGWLSGTSSKSPFSRKRGFVRASSDGR